jgi:hypothetical protein
LEPASPTDFLTFVIHPHPQASIPARHALPKKFNSRPVALTVRPHKPSDVSSKGLLILEQEKRCRKKGVRAGKKVSGIL